jgi:hypothetical protein
VYSSVPYCTHPMGVLLRKHGRLNEEYQCPQRKMNT